MFEFILFVSACTAIALMLNGIVKQLSQPKTKLIPIKIKSEKKDQFKPRRRQY